MSNLRKKNQSSKFNPVFHSDSDCAQRTKTYALSKEETVTKQCLYKIHLLENIIIYGKRKLVSATRG